MALLKQEHITFHVGLPKSASTTLQKYFYKAAPDRFLGHENSSTLSEHFLLVTKALELDLEELSTAVNEEMGEHPWLFSSEFCSSYWTPLSGAHPQSVKKIASRLYTLAPHAKVLVILRNPFKMMESLYSQLLFNESYALSPRSLSYEEWLDRNILLTEKGWQSAFDLLNYSRLIKAYSQFPNLEVRFLEEVSKDFDAFMNDWLVPWAKIEVSEDYRSSQENTRHTSCEIFAKRIIRSSLNKIKRAFPSLVSSVPETTLQKFESLWNGFILRLPGSMKNLKVRKDQKEWMHRHFLGLNAGLPDELKAKAKEFGYPVK